MDHVNVSDNFFTPDFSKKCVELMGKYPDVAIGLISQSRLDDKRPEVIQMTPGVKIDDSGAGEGLGQQYDTPESAVASRGADVIIVGRGITHSSDPGSAAETYRTAGWEAYLKRCHI
jgi:orotidine-5'-phosphate decarboxylase